MFEIMFKIFEWLEERGINLVIAYVVFMIILLFIAAISIEAIHKNAELKKQNQMCATEAAEMVWRGCVLTYEKGEAVCEIVKP